MAVTFQCNRTGGGAEFVLSERRLLVRKVIPVADWENAPVALLPAVRFLRRLQDEGRATPSGAGLVLTTEALAEIPEGLTKLLGLPPLAGLSLTLQFKSRVDTPEGEIRAYWSDTSSRRVTPRIESVFVESGGVVGRLSSPLVRLLAAISAYNATMGKAGEERIDSWLGSVLD